MFVGREKERENDVNMFRRFTFYNDAFVPQRVLCLSNDHEMGGSICDVVCE